MHKLDEFTRAYIECALWSTTYENDNGDAVCYDELTNAEELPAPLLLSMRQDCENFQTENAELLAQAGDPGQNGHDFWLTREGHGAGFWDRGYPDAIGDALTTACKAYGNGSDEFYQYAPWWNV